MRIPNALLRQAQLILARPPIPGRRSPSPLAAAAEAGQYIGSEFTSGKLIRTGIKAAEWQGFGPSKPGGPTGSVTPAGLSDANRLAEIFSNGELPKPEVIRSHLPSLLPRLEDRSATEVKYNLLLRDQRVDGSHFPRIGMLGLIPVPYEKVWKVIEDSDAWEEWMPFVLESSIIRPEDSSKSHLQLKMNFFKILNRLLSFYYEVEIYNRTTDSAYQSLFRLVNGRLDNDILTLGLGKADGWWMAGPVEDREELTYVVYEVHLDINLPESYLFAWTIEIIREVMYDKAIQHFPCLYHELMKRALDPSYQLARYEKPSPGPYRAVAGFLRREF